MVVNLQTTIPLHKPYTLTLNILIVISQNLVEFLKYYWVRRFFFTTRLTITPNIVLATQKLIYLYFY